MSSFSNGKYLCSEGEYRELRQLGKRMHLSRKLIHELDHHYKNVHAVDIPGLISIGKMNAFIGMAHDACVKGYYDTAVLIEKALQDSDDLQCMEAQSHRMARLNMFRNQYIRFIHAARKYGRSAIKKII